jgi:RNA polymerase sigma-70 factor (ECF subfamily)
MSEDSCTNLVARWRAGDEQAAAELVQRYTTRLIALARSRLSGSVAHQVDPEDIVQSAYRSFFTEARRDSIELEPNGDLWQLLVTITLHKLHNQVKRVTAQKRAAQKEHLFGSEDSLLGIQTVPLAGDPSPVEALALVELLEQVMRSLEPTERRILEMRLQGHTLTEVAAAVQCSERTVRRAMSGIRERLQRWLDHPS